jgi:tetratricopeptide (TPR) repeat protein
MRGRRVEGLAALGVVLLAVGIYAATLRNGLVWDDRTLVAGEALRRPDVLWRAFQVDTWSLIDPLTAPDTFYRPIGVLSLALDRLLGGGSPVAFHLHSILLHGLVVALAFLLLRRRGAGLAPATLAAAWFATLPASVEAVAWTAARFDLIGVALVLGALLVHRSRGRWARAATPLLLLLATLTKETFFVAPALLVLDDLLEERPTRLRDFARAHAADYGAIALALGVSLGLRAHALTVKTYLVAGRSAATVLGDGLTTVGGMVQLAVAPFPLSVTRPYQPLGPAGLALVAAGIAAAGIAAWRAPPLRLGLAWFAVGCVLPSLFMRGTGYFGERYLYFPALGLALAGAAAADLLRSASLRRIAGGVVALVVVLQAAASAARVPDWRDDRTLFGAALEVRPDDAFALFELGYAEARDGRWPEAAALYRRALAIDRSDPRLLSNAAAAFDRVGDPASAAEVGRLAVAASPTNPRARYNHALPLARLGRLDEAQAELETALRMAPGYAKARELLAEIQAARARTVLPKGP